jgi:hypothetical protein
MMKYAMILETVNAMRAALLGPAVAIAALAAGCGDPDAVPTSLKTYPVKGKVVLADGKPLSSGVVVLASPEKGMEFEGRVQPDGTFQVKSSYGDGAPEGAYKIRIQADTSKPGDGKSKGRRSGANLPYPPRYGDEATSGLTAVVKPSDNDLEPITLAK